jgi:hypothetical protein
MSVNVNCKSPHAADEITGRVSGNVNCKPSHAADAIVGRLSVIGNSIFEEGTKAEWFFDKSRASVRQQWAADRKAVRPQVRDQDFLAKNTARGGVSVFMHGALLALRQLFDFISCSHQIPAKFQGGDPTKS